MSPPVASRSLIVIHDWLRSIRQQLTPYLTEVFRSTPASGTARPGKGSRQAVV